MPNILENKRNVEWMWKQSLKAFKLFQHRFNILLTCFNNVERGWQTLSTLPFNKIERTWKQMLKPLARARCIVAKMKLLYKWSWTTAEWFGHHPCIFEVATFEVYISVATGLLCRAQLMHGSEMLESREEQSASCDKSAWRDPPPPPQKKKKKKKFSMHGIRYEL